MPMIRTGPESIAQYGPGCTARWDACPRNARASSRRWPSPWRGRCHSRERSQARPDGRGAGSAGSGGASQKTRMKAPRSSYQSWLPGIAYIGAR